MVTEARARWTNWGGTYSCTPTRIESPASEEEIAAIVRVAVARGEHVKVIGSGHSFTDIGCTDGCLIKLDNYNKVLDVDREAATITVQAGITILQLSDALAHFGLALENMGDVGYQTISGAVSTATHGTGERFRNISSQVTGLSLVLASGDVLRCTPGQDANAFKAAQVGLGALGVLSTVTLRCVPAYNVHSVQQPRRIEFLCKMLSDLNRTGTSPRLIVRKQCKNRVDDSWFHGRTFGGAHNALDSGLRSFLIPPRKETATEQLLS